MASSVVPIRAVKVSKAKAKAPATPKVFTLRFYLEHSSPVIWRQIQIDSRATLEVLHHVVQTAMGWTDAHLHEFDIAGKRYAKLEDDEYGDFPETLDEALFTLQDLLKKNKPFSYLYDFGDGWRHGITLIASTQATQSICDVGSAWVEDGQRACPPEDCGGIGSYQEFLQNDVIAPEDTDVLEFRDWVGRDFDPAFFDRRAANAAIARMFWNHWIVIAGTDT